VGEQVHRQGGHRNIGLAAGVALLGRLRVQGAMRLLVARQIRGGGILFATLAALVAAPLPLGIVLPIARRAV